MNSDLLNVIYFYTHYPLEGELRTLRRNAAIMYVRTQCIRRDNTVSSSYFIKRRAPSQYVFLH